MRECPDCGAAVSTDAALCPHRGRPLEQMAKRYGSGHTLVLGVLVFFTAVIGRTLIHVSGPGRPKTTARASKTSGPKTLRPGDRGRLERTGVAAVFLAADGGSWVAMIEAEDARDSEAITRLVTSGKVLRLPVGTRVRVISQRGSSILKVRILSGNSFGGEGYAQREFVKPAN
jgi:hypothetical protein